MIVVEGPDGAGKSRLAKKLSLQLEIPIADKAVSPDARAQTSIKHYVEKSLDGGYRREIYDRHALISSPIYTCGLRRVTTNEGFDDMRWLATAYSRWRELAPTVIICLPPFEEVWKNCQRDVDNRRLFPTKSTIFGIYMLYFNLAARNPAMLMYDYTRHHEGLMIDFVASALKERHV